MTVVTISFPDERISSKHLHAQFDAEDDARFWVYWLKERYGRMDVSYDETKSGWACPECGLRSARVTTPKAAVGRFGLTDLE